MFGLGKALAEEVKGREDFELAMDPEANIVCFRHLPERVRDRSPEEQDRFTAAVRQRHLEEGPQYVVQTRFGGCTWLRCTLMNPMTEVEDLRAMLDRVAELGRGVILP